MLQADPGSHELLSELLLPHLRNFVPDSSSRDQPPLLLHQCAGLLHVSAHALILEQQSTGRAAADQHRVLAEPPHVRLQLPLASPFISCSKGHLLP